MSAATATATANAAAAAAASVLAAASAAAFSGPTRVHQVARLQRRRECTSRVAGLSPTHTLASCLRKQVSGRTDADAAAAVPAAARPPALAACHGPATATANSRRNRTLTPLSLPQATSSAYVSLPSAASYTGYAPLTLIPGLMTAADQLSNFGAVVHAPLVAKSLPPAAGRADRLEVSSCTRSRTRTRSATATASASPLSSALVVVSCRAGVPRVPTRQLQALR